MKRIIPCVFITLAMILAGIYFPSLNLIALMLCPLPLSILGNIEGHKRMSIAELLIEATLFFAFSQTMAVYFLIACAPVSAMIFMLGREEYKEAKNHSGPESLLICIGTSITFKIVLMLVFWIFTDKNILMPDFSQMDSMFAQVYETQPELQESIRRILRVFPYLMPSMLIIYCSIESFLNYSFNHKLTRKFFPETKNYVPELPVFTQWRFPFSLFWVSMLSLILGYFVDSDTWFDGTVFIMNLQIVINIIMFIQGLSLIFWLMESFKFRRGAKVFACIILFIPFFWAWLVIIGMSDMILNLRERIRIGTK